MPAGTVGVLGDRATLDARTKEHTLGLIEKLPVRVFPTTVLGTVAPCSTVTRQETRTGDSVRLELPPFEVRSEHDLTDNAALFGLSAALRVSDKNFPGLADGQLMVEGAGQNVVARFDATGFEAAAVTAVAMARSGPPKTDWATVTSVRIDRPFGFLAVDRPTGLVMVAGQVTEPPTEWTRPVGTGSARI